MAQEIDKAIPVLQQAAKLSKDGKAYVLLGNLYLAEDKLDKAVDSIKKGLKKGKIENDIMTYDETRKSMKIMDDIREVIGLKYPFE